MSQNKIEKVKLLMDYFHRSMMHHALWFGEMVHQYGREDAFQALEEVWKKMYDIQMTRLSKILEFSLIEGVPESLVNLPDEKLDKLLEGVAVNWLATDGVWFQSVEFSKGMSDAKRINDSCWAQFSPFEAWSVKKILGLPDNSGLEGLKKALQYRIYASVNEQSVVNETENSFEFRMNNCRVQNARKRKGLDDYPCKSGGIIEYSSFAKEIDKRIKTECIGCPPDPHPEEWFCAWRFTIDV